jgi:hypothetical protein
MEASNEDLYEAAAVIAIESLEGALGCFVSGIQVECEAPPV